MDEEIFAAIIRDDEAKTLLFTKPLDRTLCHFVFSLDPAGSTQQIPSFRHQGYASREKSIHLDTRLYITDRRVTCQRKRGIPVPEQQIDVLGESAGRRPLPTCGRGISLGVCGTSDTARRPGLRLGLEAVAAPATFQPGAVAVRPAIAWCAAFGPLDAMNQFCLLHFAWGHTHLLCLALDVSHCHALRCYAYRCHIRSPKLGLETPFSSLPTWRTSLPATRRAGLSRRHIRPISPSVLSGLHTNVLLQARPMLGETLRFCRKTYATAPAQAGKPASATVLHQPWSFFLDPASPATRVFPIDRGPLD